LELVGEQVPVAIQRHRRRSVAELSLDRLDELSLSASDVIHLAIARLQDQLSDDDLRTELIAHVRAEAKQYPGRARRGLPGDEPRT
jgi:hypothetical protein